jgi:hypothetical protein
MIKENDASFTLSEGLNYRLRIDEVEFGDVKSVSCQKQYSTCF